jgi:Plavaka transposase
MVCIFFHLCTAILILSSNSGKPCNKAGDFLLDPRSLPPPTINTFDSNDWTPFRDEIAFRTAEYFFKEDQTSAGKIDHLLELWAATLAQHGDTPPFSDHQDLYNVIDSISVGGVPWESHIFTYEGECPEQDPPKWMTTEYTIWYRDPRQLFHNMIGNPEFTGHIDYAPLRQFGPSEDEDELVREYENFMSGDWAWKQAVCPCNIILWISLIY